MRMTLLSSIVLESQTIILMTQDRRTEGRNEKSDGREEGVEGSHATTHGKLYNPCGVSQSDSVVLPFPSGENAQLTFGLTGISTLRPFVSK